MFNVTLVKWLDSPTVPQFLMWSAPHPCPAWLTCVDCAKVNAPQSQRNCRVTTMGLQEKINANPTVYAVDTYASKKYEVYDETDEESMDPFEADEIFEMLRHVNDPEHPLTLEQLKVMAPENIHVDDAKSHVCVYFTPTIPHCSMATLIGLCLRVKLLRSLPSRFKVDILITPGTHSSEAAVNKQLNDKERVAAALENSHLLHVVNKCIANTDK